MSTSSATPDSVPVTTDGQQKSVVATTITNGSPDSITRSGQPRLDSSINTILLHKRWGRTLTLIGIGIAVIWVLILQSYLIVTLRPDPAKTELTPFSSGGQLPHSPSPTNSGPEQMPSSSAAGQAPVQGAVATGNNANEKETNRIITTSSWPQVANSALLLGSCASVFAVLVWAAVSLNREDD